MKKLLLISTAFLFSLALFSHPPKDIKLSYSLDKKELKIVMPHPVDDVADHYMESVEVYVNGDEVTKVDYTKQSSKQEHSATIKVDASKGDKIKVKAKCNKLGRKTEKITVK